MGILSKGDIGLTRREAREKQDVELGWVALGLDGAVAEVSRAGRRGDGVVAATRPLLA